MKNSTILLVCMIIFLNGKAQTFPLQLSNNRRYLVDQNKEPFLIKEISAWGLIQTLPEEEAAEFMDRIKVKGFNTMLVSVISADTRFAGSPPGWNGNSPFNNLWDFSTPNDRYFAHVDRILEMAGNKGLLVLLVPCYLGYWGDPNQGWEAKLLDGNNDTTKSRIYGRFLGNRYKNQTNIIWVAGGDNHAGGITGRHMVNIIEGISETETSGEKHLWTAHWSSDKALNWSSSNKQFAPFIDLDGLYCFVEKDLGPTGPQYKTELQKYDAGKIYFQLDQSYEKDIPGGPDNMNDQWIRRKNYDGLLSGCAGTSFSPGIDKDTQLYKFFDWRKFMNTKGMNEAMYCFNLFESRPWYNLVPDQNTMEFISDGRGSYGDIDYACVARTSDGSTVITYIPNGRSITVKMTAISGSHIKAWWYDPQNGKAILIGDYLTTGEQTFTSSGGDKVLVLDNADLNPGAPGSVLNGL